LLSRLTLDEKVAMMNHPAQGVPRLNIPAYNYWNEALKNSPFWETLRTKDRRASHFSVAWRSLIDVQ